MSVCRAGLHLAAWLVLVTGSRPGVAQTPQALIDRTPARAETHHVGTFGGTKVAYTAMVEEHVLQVDAFEAVGDAMKRFPRMRMAWMAGYFDLTTPAYESEYIFDQVGISPDRTTALVVAGAHGSIADPSQRPALARALRTWIR